MSSKEEQMKTALKLSLALIIILSATIAYNYIEIKKLNSIAAGEYFTESQCREMFSLIDTQFNIQIPPLEMNDSVRGVELQT